MSATRTSHDGAMPCRGELVDQATVFLVGMDTLGCRSLIELAEMLQTADRAHGRLHSRRFGRHFGSETIELRRPYRGNEHLDRFEQVGPAVSLLLGDHHPDGDSQ